jgi:predicted GNAT superfamily acetyltransferase
LTYLDHDGPALRSQVTGTVRRRHGVGEALKLHQRSWATTQGMRRITWTFDPLVRTNARFNLERLGARIVRFVPDFYGSLDDSVNGNDETDRCVVNWELVHQRPAPPITTREPLGDEHQVLLGSDQAGNPLITAAEGSAFLVATPEDIVTLRRQDPERAVRWRRAVREAFTTAFDAGLEADLVTSDGSYRFCRPDRDASST